MVCEPGAFRVSVVLKLSALLLRSLGQILGTRARGHSATERCISVCEQDYRKHYTSTPHSALLPGVVSELAV